MKNGQSSRFVGEISALVESIRMRKGQDASVVVVRVGDGLEAEIGELGGDFSHTLRRFGLDHESVRTPSHNRDFASIAKIAGGIEPWRILRAREKRDIGAL